MDNPGVICGCLHIYPVMLWTILGSSMVVYIYIQSCCGQSWGHLWLSTYISSHAVDNPGVIYGCLHIYPVMLWAILGSSMVVYIYIQSCGQSWGHLWLSTYISSHAVDNPWGHLWLSTYISSNAVDNPVVICGCLHIYPVIPWTILGSSMVVHIYIQ